MSAFLKASLVFIFVVIAIVSSVTNKTDNFCVVCNKCCQKNVESTRKILSVLFISAVSVFCPNVQECCVRLVVELYGRIKQLEKLSFA